MAPSLEQVATHGLWGQPTSTIDWCEQNYEVTYLIAEFWNSISNLMFIVPPIVAASHLWNKLDRIYCVSLLYMAFTGMGSFAFHATLRFSMQLWDELSMVWSGLFILYLIIRIFKGNESSASYVLPLAAYGIATCTVYLYSNTPVIFQVAYGCIHFTVLILAYKLKHLYPVDMRLYWSTVIMSTAGFVLWNIDNNMCPSLERFRSVLRSMPGTSCLTPVTQFHALWHCLAGYGAFCMVMFVMQARLFSLRKLFSLSLHPLSGLTLQQVQVEDEESAGGAGGLMTSTATTSSTKHQQQQQQQSGPTSTDLVTQEHRSSPGTIRFISNAVSAGYSQLMKSYHNRKRD